MLIVFFDWKGVVHHEFVPRGETVNKEFYLKVMKRLREAVRRKRPEAWTNKTWMLHHDNAPPHTSLLIREFLAKQETIVVPQPPYSPALAPADFFLFPKLKSTLKGRRFHTVEIKENSLQDLRAILQNTFQNWKKCWERCINSRGEYFEGDKSD
jgi:transposase